jgi:manganese/zinc/iron transport system substrate-binding protein
MHFPSLIILLAPRVVAAFSLCLALTVLGGCGAAGSQPAGAGDRPVRVVASATMVGDMVEAIGGDRIAVDTLMGPGVDPHLFRPSVMDIRRLSRADAVFYVGLHFESLLQEVLVQRERTGQKVFALGDAIPEDRLIPTDEAAGLYDPHVWFDASIWIHCVDAVVEGLSELAPDSAELFEERGEAYRRKLRELHEWAQKTAAEVPEAQRVLVSSHDAYNYFGRAYGFEVVGLMGISTASEAGLADITRLVDFIRERKIKAIFVESSVSPRAIERVSRDSGVVIGGELFSDALGAKGELRRGFDVGTYEGMIRYNLSTIVEALR